MKTVTVFLLLFCVSYCYANPPADINSIYATWTANYGSVQVHKVQCVITLLSSVLGPDATVPKGTKPISVFYKEITTDGNNFLLRYSTDPNGIDGADARTYLIDGNTTKCYMKPVKTLNIRAGTTIETHKINEALECMLMKKGRYFRYDFQDSWVSTLPDKTIKLLPDMETILGYPCYVVELYPKNKIWFAPDLGMLPLKYIHAHPETGFIFEQVDVQRVNSVKTSKGMWWYPEVSIYRQNYPASGDNTRTVQVLKMDPEFPITKDTFKLVVPANTIVWDEILKKQYVIGLTDANLIPSIMVNKN
jgi:hypothetical protein